MIHLQAKSIASILKEIGLQCKCQTKVLTVLIEQEYHMRVYTASAWMDQKIHFMPVSTWLCRK